MRVQKLHRPVGVCVRGGQKKVKGLLFSGNICPVGEGGRKFFLVRCRFICYGLWWRELNASDSFMRGNIFSGFV